MRCVALLAALAGLACAGCSGSSTAQSCQTDADCTHALPSNCDGTTADADGGPLRSCYWICSENLCEVGQ